MTQGDDYQRLADYVGARMDELKLDNQALAALMEMTTRNVTNVLAGKSVGPKTRSALDSALKWEPGSARQVIAGGKPQPLEMGAGERIALADALRRLDAAQQALQEAVALLRPHRALYVAPPAEDDQVPTRLGKAARPGRSAKKAMIRSRDEVDETP